MKFFRWACVATSVLIACSGERAFRGDSIVLGTESHGTGGLLDRYNPWFLVAEGKDRPIEYCVESDPTSVYERDEYRAIVEQAITQWRAFFDRYDADRRWLGEDAHGIKIRFLDGKRRRLALSFREKPNCDHPAEQLRFVFGPKPPQGESVDGRWSTALGAAARGPYDHDTYWNGGVVWIHNRYREGRRVVPRAKLHVVLHELGHVFGMRHNETWVMYENAADETSEPLSNRDYSAALGHIELPAWRFRLRKGDALQFSRLNCPLDPKGTDSQPELALFRALGANASKVLEEVVYEGVQEDGTHGFSLKLSDENGRLLTTLKGSFVRSSIQFRMDQPLGPGVFTRWFVDGALVKSIGAFWPEPEVLPTRGQFVAADGKKYEAHFHFKYGASLYLSMPEQKGWLRWRANGLSYAHERNDWDY